jgi:competence protein ComFC
MLKRIETIWSYLINSIFPLRKDFDIVKNLNEEKINSLPKANSIQISWIHPLFSYRDNKVRAIIWELKYKENTLPLEFLGRLLYEEIIAVISDIILFDSDAEFILLPIPITDDRKVERGYNQSEYIAKSILENDLEHTLLYAPQWFYKIKETPRQSHSQSKQERVENLADSFEADERVGSKYVILVDDVVTTGSTLEEAKKTLLGRGARDVFAFTIAH